MGHILNELRKHRRNALQNSGNMNIKFCNTCNKEIKREDDEEVHRVHEECRSCYSLTWRKKRQDASPRIFCKCGCGEMIPSITLAGKPMQYKLDHVFKNRW